MKSSRRTMGATLIAGACLAFFAFGFKGGSWVTERLAVTEVEVVARHPNIDAIDAARSPVEPLRGRWAQYRQPAGSASPLAMYVEELGRLASIGYVQGSHVAVNSAVVTRYDPSREYNSPTLVVSGHAPSAELIDTDGNVLHTWSCSFEEVWPRRDVRDGESQKYFWRRVHLYPDGSLLAIFEYLGAVKLDAHSNVIWARTNSFNHDISVAKDGTIYMLEQKPTQRPAVNPDLEIMDDHVTRLTPDGAVIDSVSLVDCVLNSPCHDLLDRVVLESADIFHSNTLKVITEEQSRAWPLARPGMVLVSLRELHTIALVDLLEKKVVWWSTDIARYQHEPTVTPHGTILLFDNIWCGGRSRVIEIDPATNEIVWQYIGTQDKPFFSLTCSTAQFLPNGNRLITVSDEGRAFSLDPDGNIVWEYVNPHRAGENDELIATLFQCQRLPKGFPIDWVDRASNQKTANVQEARDAARSAGEA
ncbi:MAG: hypothetical protein HUU46_04320 [Candidatus Hydrogenedentes bacterium]|nr:hypothetical protein [Candidatus Hydrogenedentota bacterium]